MSRVDDWFWGFIERHMGRHPRPDWPRESREFWEGFRSALVKHGVTEGVADEASVAMMERPAPFPDRFVSEFLAAVKAVWASAESVPAGLADRDAAVLAAAAQCGGPCPDCRNQGFAVRYRRDSLGLDRGDGRPVSPAVVFYCRCPVGRWVERRHREGDEAARAVRKRTPDLADHPGLWGDEFRTPPGDGGAPPPADTMALLRSLVEAHRLERAAPERRDPRHAPPGAAEVAFAQARGYTPEQAGRFYAMSPADRSQAMRRDDPVLDGHARALMGEPPPLGPSPPP